MKTLSLTQAARISVIFRELDTIDKNLKNLNKRAELAVDSDHKSNIHLCAPDGHDDDGGIGAVIIKGIIEGMVSKQIKCLDMKVSDKAVLQIIGILIASKSAEKKMLTDELRDYGIEINHEIS